MHIILYVRIYKTLRYVTNNGTTIPSPVDIEQFKSGYQLNGCVRVSRVYTDAALGERVSKVFSEVQSMNDSLRVPPDGQESAALLRNAENNGQNCGTLVSFSCANTNGVYAGSTSTSRSATSRSKRATRSGDRPSSRSTLSWRRLKSRRAGPSSSRRRRSRISRIFICGRCGCERCG